MFSLFNGVAPTVRSRTSYWSPLVTTRSPSSLERTSRQAITRFDTRVSAMGRHSPSASASSMLPMLGCGLVVGVDERANEPCDELPKAIDSYRQSRTHLSRKVLRMRRPVVPLFSGWNCVAITRPCCTALLSWEWYVVAV